MRSALGSLLIVSVLFAAMPSVAFAQAGPSPTGASPVVGGSGGIVTGPNGQRYGIAGTVSGSTAAPGGTAAPGAPATGSDGRDTPLPGTVRAREGEAAR